MTVHSTSPQFKQNAARALNDGQLQKALGNVKQGFIDKRQAAADKLPEFEALRDAARDIKNHTLEHLDLYLEAYEEKVKASGGHVHFARNADEARDIILRICRDAGAKTVTKGKSMISEEIGINHHLEAKGIRPVETDLGEYIIQLRNELPSHIIAPAVHLNATQVEEDFRRVHTHLDAKRDLSEPVQLLTEARAVLRERFLAADVGITGANFLVAETGTSIIVTNEGNGDLTQILPKTHIVLASIEKLVPTLEDARPEASRATPNASAAPPPTRVPRPACAASIESTPVWPVSLKSDAAMRYARATLSGSCSPTVRSEVALDRARIAAPGSSATRSAHSPATTASASCSSSPSSARPL